jgi:hypothetical protein
MGRDRRRTRETTIERSPARGSNIRKSNMATKWSKRTNSRQGREEWRSSKAAKKKLRPAVEDPMQAKTKLPRMNATQATSRTQEKSALQPAFKGKREKMQRNRGQIQRRRCSSVDGALDDFLDDEIGGWPHSNPAEHGRMQGSECQRTQVFANWHLCVRVALAQRGGSTV